MRLSDFKALSFDCYGTLIDWEAGLTRALEPLRERIGISEDGLLEVYGEAEHEVEEEHPGLRYSELLTIVHARLAERFGLPADEAAARDSVNRSATGRPSPIAPKRFAISSDILS